jgi:hypothetical protein
MKADRKAGRLLFIRRTLVRSARITGVVLCASVALAKAAENDANYLDRFIPQCSQWVVQADRFYDECKTNARYSHRVFYPSGRGPGEPESNGIWFASAPEGSHFVMGCSLWRKGELSFLGLYYTTNPAILPELNTAPLQAVDFNGNAVLMKDGRSVVLTAVRPFDTEKVRTRARGMPWLNCVNPMGPNGYYSGIQGSTEADFSRFDQDGTITLTDKDFRKTARYVEFFRSSLPRDILFMEGSSLFIGSAGNVLVERRRIEQACTPGRPEAILVSPSIIHQLCPVRGVEPDLK